MKRSTNFALLAIVAALVTLFAFDAVAASHLMQLGPEGLAMAPIAAATLPETIKSELERIRTDAVGPVAGLQRQVQELEQVVAQLDQGGGRFMSDGGPSVGASAVAAFAEDPAFVSASEAAARGMKPSQFSARINVDSSIRAALVGEDWGGVDDTEIPSRPERRGMRGGVFAPLRLIEALPSRRTTSDSVEFIQVDPASGDADYQLKHGDEKAEIEIEGTLKRAYIATIAAHTTASKQVLADHAALGQQVDRVIRAKVFSKLEYELINGAGTDGTINGLLNQSTTLVPAKATTPADIIGEALTTQALLGFRPSLILVNPWDWFELQIEKDLEGRYLFGSPTSPMSPSVWGGRVVQTPALTAGTALTLDTGYVTVLDREQMSVAATNTHEDYFVRNLLKILGELRAGLEVIDTRAVQKFSLDGPVPPSS